MSMPQSPEGRVSAPPPSSPHGPTEQLPIVEPPPPPPPAAVKAPAQPKRARRPIPPVVLTAWALGVISVAAVVVGLSVTEDHRTFWDLVNAWGAVAIVGAVLTLAPAVAPLLNRPARPAWQVAVCGAGALLLFWVLFVLPRVGSNVTLLLSVGVAAGVIAAWVAPGRERR
jgi:hypothetical protein